MASKQHIYRSGRAKLVFSRTVSSPPHSLPFARMRGTKKGHTSLLICLDCDVPLICGRDPTLPYRWSDSSHVRGACLRLSMKTIAAKPPQELLCLGSENMWLGNPELWLMSRLLRDEARASKALPVDRTLPRGACTTTRGLPNRKYQNKVLMYPLHFAVYTL